MSLTPPLRNPGDDQPVMPRPRGPEKTGVYICELYYTASKRYFRAPKTPRWGNVVLRHVSLGKFCRLRCQNGKREAKINDFSGFYELCMGLTHIEELRQ